MSRERKFRKWDGEKFDYSPILRVPKDAYKLNLNIHFSAVSYLEYTGKVDKKGKEIYESDRVLALIGDYGSHFYCVVEYSDERAAFVLKGSFPAGEIFLSEAKEIEVTGNIFENESII